VKTPAAPSSLRVTSVTHDKISLAWDASQSDVSHYIVVMREAGKKKFKKVAKVDGSELTCSLTTGFEQNQEYIFRVYAENEVIKICNLLCGYGKEVAFRFKHYLQSVCLSICNYPIKIIIKIIHNTTINGNCFNR